MMTTIEAVVLLLVVVLFVLGRLITSLIKIKFINDSRFYQRPLLCVTSNFMKTQIGNISNYLENHKLMNFEFWFGDGIRMLIKGSLVLILKIIAGELGSKLVIDIGPQC